MTSGKVLAEARERKGYDLATVARRLRIRPDILRAIEAGDFASMPPRGYTRNMVNAYARLLGLNPTEIVDMYLDEAYAHQVQRARDKAPSSHFNMERETVLTRRARTNVSDADAFGTSSVRNSYLSQSADRDLYDDRTRFSRDDYGLTREARTREGRTERDFLSHHSGYPSNAFSFMDERGSRFSRGRDIQVGSTPMQYSASRLPGFLQNKGALIIAIILAVVVVAAIVMLVLSHRNNDEVNDVSQLAVSGINDTTQGEDDSSAAAEPVVAIAPESARVVYSLKKGQDAAWLEIYADGTTQPTGEYLTDTTEHTLEVTGTWTITCWEPDKINLEVDGESKSLTADSNYGGMPSYTVDFNAILEQWAQDHPNSKVTRRATANAEANADQQAAAAAGSDDAAGSTYDDGAIDYGYDTSYDDGSYYDDTYGYGTYEDGSQDYTGYEDYTYYDDGSQDQTY